MRRVFLEWALIFAVGMTLSLTSLWAVSRFFDRRIYHLRIQTSPSLGDHFYVIVGGGDLSLCDDFDSDASGNIRPYIVDPRRMIASDILRGDRAGQFTVPGIDLHYYRLMPAGSVIWSLRLSLLWPSLISLSGAFVLHSRLKRLQSRLGRDSA
ncbi:hypothetical protein TA3x_003951 [Tundrisphaera sp. TA3]|uniref:hypothetical protein n=1 Tax=Tundrisphaera sp. TA3 TaxID=3435775 RepID=UPI003EBA22E9